MRNSLALGMGTGKAIFDMEATTMGVEITIHQDGQTLHGTRWITPADFAEAEVADGWLPSLKGRTPAEWPRLEGDQGVTDDRST